MRLLVLDPQGMVKSSVFLGLQAEGFVIDRTNSVEKGVWMVKTNCYDLLILASHAGGKDIYLELEKIFDSSAAPINILLLVNFISLERKIFLLEKGVDEIINFPCSLRELVLKVKLLARREKSQEEKTGIYCSGDLIIDRNTFKVFRNGEEIALRKKEFDLLYYFLRHQGRIISRTQIMEGVWGADRDLFTNTLEVHILNLRRKIDRNSPANGRLIHTVYGRGYLFGLRSSLSSLASARAAALSIT
ncbi:MAG: response regulator transcription factor [Candidatus Moranbacteria bacterium]|nr:response regulator transcription factor [Candidatus Moranbacteria bacterium]